MEAPPNKITGNKLLFYAVVLLWIIVNLFQAYFSGLINDEAYYRFYSLDLAWGYYDHPPMIAVLIKAGYALINNYLGVRLFIVILSAGVLILLEKLIKPKNYLLFSLFILSIFIFQADGFIAVPDTVFIFFATLFFYSYKRYLSGDSVTNIFLLIISITGMFYSKYFAVLVIFFTLISNVNILKRKSFWIIFTVSAIAMIPHLIWQINNDFVTFYFHLKERNVNVGFSLLKPLEFIGGQLLLLNPLIVFFILKYFLKSDKKEIFNKALWLNVIGVFGFAFIFSFFKNVEANWTISAFVPLVILSYPQFEKRLGNKKTFYVLSALSLIIILFLRINIAFNLSGNKAPGILKQFYGWENASKKIAKLAGNRTVIFSCSYQNASQYLFHTGKSSFTFNNLFYRKNQYDLTDIEPQLQGKPQLFIKDKKYLDEHFEKPFVIPEPDSIILFGKWWYYKNIKHYYSYNFLKINVELKDKTLKSDSTINIPVEIINPLDSAIVISPDVKSFISVCFAVKNRPYKYEPVENVSGLKLDKSYKTILSVKTPDKPGNYYLWVSIQSGWLPPAINHRIIKVKVKD